MSDGNLPEKRELPPSWQPLAPRLRRVAGVLIEKAKTTPDVYPMSLNAITTACNQKNNRFPVTNYSTDDVQECLDKLRELGAVSEIQGSGRVPKFRHHLYEWLGVDKQEIAVMAELLLRGEQTVGDLRTRASRMEPITDQAALRPILQSLIQKKLVLELTPEGRGQIVTHNLHKDRELEEVRARAARHVPESNVNGHADAEFSAARESPRPSAVVRDDDAIAEIREELTQMRREMDELRTIVEKFQQFMQ